MQKEIPMGDEVSDAVSAIRDEILGLKQKREKLEQRKANLELRKRELLSQPVKGAALRQFVNELIDYRASAYVDLLKEHDFYREVAFPAPGERLRRNQLDLSRPALSFEDTEEALHHIERPSRDGMLRLAGWGIPIFQWRGEFGLAWAYFFFGDVIKEKIAHFFPDDEADSDDESLERRRVTLGLINDEMREVERDLFVVRGKINGISALVEGVKYAEREGGEE